MSGDTGNDIHLIQGRDPYRLKEIKAKYGDLDLFFFTKLNELQTIKAVKQFIKQDSDIDVAHRTIKRYIAGKMKRRFCWIATEFLNLPSTSQETE